MYVTVRGSGRYVGRTRLRDRVRHISLSESQCKHHNPLQDLGSSGNMAELRMRIQHAPPAGTRREQHERGQRAKSHSTSGCLRCVVCVYAFSVCRDAAMCDRWRRKRVRAQPRVATERAAVVRARSLPQRLSPGCSTRRWPVSVLDRESPRESSTQTNTGGPRVRRRLRLQTRWKPRQPLALLHHQGGGGWICR